MQSLKQKWKRDIMEDHQSNLGLTELKLHTNIAQENWKKHKTVQCTENYNSKVHPEVEYPEYFRVCKDKN